MAYVRVRHLAALAACTLACATVTDRGPDAPRSSAAAVAPAAVTPGADDLARGEEALRENRFGEAESRFLAAAARAPGDPRPLTGLAQARYGQGRADEAIEDLTRSLAVRETAPALLLRGRYHGAARRFDEAARDLERSVELDPRSGLGWSLLAVVHVNRGDDVGAARAFGGATATLGASDALDRFWTLLLATPPDPVQPQEALDRCGRGYAHLMEGRWQEAHHEQINALRYSRDFEWCIAGIAETAWRLGQSERAEQIFRRTIASYPPRLEALRADSKGKLAALLLAENRSLAEAAELARAALAVRGERAALLDVLGRACEAIGDLPCARDAFERLRGSSHLPEAMRSHAEERLRALSSPAPRGEARGDAGPLFRVLQGGKWGYIDRAGKIVIPPRFDRAEPFSEGLASVQDGLRLGYIDASGRMVLVPEHEPASTIHRGFSSGLAAVRKGARYGYVDRSGRLVIPLQYARAEDFSEGFALVCDTRGCGYIDRSGGVVIQPVFMGGKPVRHGLGGAYVAMAMGRERIALYDFASARQIGEFEGIGTPSDGLLAVLYNGLWGYIDLQGKGAISPRWEWAGDFAEGLAPVKTELDLCGYIDRSGALAIPPRFRSCEPFAEGLARVDLARERSEAHRVAFIDRTGRAVVVGAEATPPFDGAEDFSDGLAAVASGGEPALAGTGPLLGYIDTGGRYVWTPTE